VSDLTAFRDHCRKMAGPPVAPGCPAADERALWLRLADEVDAYLTGDPDTVGLPVIDDDQLNLLGDNP